MSIADEKLKSEVGKVLYRFLKENFATLNPCEANRILLLNKVRELLLDPTDYQSFVVAREKLGSTLASKEQINIPAPFPEVEPAPAPLSIPETNQQREKRLRSMSIEELRAVVRRENPRLKGSLQERSQILPRTCIDSRTGQEVLLTRKYIYKTATAAQMRQWQSIYGFKAIQMRLDSVDGVFSEEENKQ